MIPQFIKRNLIGHDDFIDSKIPILKKRNGSKDSLAEKPKASTVADYKRERPTISRLTRRSRQGKGPNPLEPANIAIIQAQSFDFDSRQSEPMVKKAHGVVNYPSRTTQPIIGIEDDMVITYGTKKTPLITRPPDNSTRPNDEFIEFRHE